MHLGPPPAPGPRCLRLVAVDTGPQARPLCGGVRQALVCRMLSTLRPLPRELGPVSCRPLHPPGAVRAGLLHTRAVTLGTSLPLSEPQLPHLQGGATHNETCPMELLEE